MGNPLLFEDVLARHPKPIQGGVAVSGIGWAVLALAVRGSATVGFLDLMPGLLIAGVGLGRSS